MVGKTAREVARTATQFVNTASQPSYAPPVTTQVNNGGGTGGFAQAPGMPDPNLMYSDPARYQAEMFAYQNAMVQQQLAQAAAPLAQQTVSLVRENARRGKYSDVWKRFEPEILAEVHGIQDPRMHTVELYEKAAEIVQGRHWREFVNAEVERTLANGGMGTERANGGGAAPSSPSSADALDSAWDSDHPYFERVRSTFRTKTEFRDHVRNSLKLPIDTFVNNILANKTITATSRGFERVSA